MTDVQPDETTAAPAGEGAAAEAPPVTPEDMISRGKGLKLDAIEDGTPAAEAVAAFRAFVDEYNAAEQTFESLKEQRAAQVYNLKANHNVGFSAIAEVMGVTSSLALYLYERAQGKSAKQIREESQRSAAAKEAFRESDPDRKPARKQTPEERAFRKQQREELQKFLEAQKAAGAEVEDLEPEPEPEPEDDEG